MPRKADLPKVRVHLMIYQEDYEFLKEQFDRDVGIAVGIGISEAVAKILHAKVMDLRARAAEKYEQQQRVLQQQGGQT